MKLTSRRPTVVATSLALVLAGGLAGAVWAQSLPRTQAEFEQQVGITADQKAKIKAIDAKYAPKKQAVAAKYKAQYESLQKQMADLRNKVNADMLPIYTQEKNEDDAVLTPAQREKVKKIQAAVKAQQMQQMGGGAGGVMAPKR